MQPLCQSTLGNKSSYLAEMDRDSASEWCVNVLSRIGLVRTAVCREVCRVIAEKRQGSTIEAGFRYPARQYAVLT